MAPSNCNSDQPLRVGAVNYLNTKPLVYGLQQLLPEAHLVYDLPSRLADALCEGELDIALVPSIEVACRPDWTIVSDACIGCRGPVLSVKLLFRVAPAEVHSLALDEGSRTSAVLAQILLQDVTSIHPDLKPLPIGCGPESTDADAVLMIGDRAIQCDEQPFVEVWDLGERWCHWTELPFVFAMWVARREVDITLAEKAFVTARDNGCQHLVDIAKQESAAMGLSEDLVLKYLQKYLNFRMGAKEHDGLAYFFQRANRLDSKTEVGLPSKSS